MSTIANRTGTRATPEKELEALDMRLCAAVQSGATERVRAVLDKGADANSQRRTQLYKTTLEVAIDTRSPEIVHLLLERGANPNLGDKDYPPLHRAIRDVSTEIVRLLLEYGADRTRLDMDGRTALMLAREYYLDPIIALLDAPCQ